MKYRYIYLTLFLLGIILRLSYLSDMEWKYDQAWMYYHASDLTNTFPWSIVGMKSGGGIVNPAFGLWIFGLMSFFGKTPVELVTIVSLLNIFSLLILIYFVFKKLTGVEADRLKKTIVLVSVSPMAILFSRNIWAQDILSFFSTLFIISIYLRQSKWGMFFWGLTGALLGQIHMPGFFYALGVLFFFIIYDFRKGQRSHWVFWIIGSIIGALPLIPWLIHIINQPFVTSTPDPNNSGIIEFKHIFKFRFYTYMMLESLGIHLKYSLGEHFWQFIKWPSNSYFIGIIHLFLTYIGFYALIGFFKNIKNELKSNHSMDVIAAACWFGGGAALTILGLKMHPHYIIVAFPFSYYFFIRLVEKFSERIQLISICAHFLVSAAFIFFIHDNNGAIGQEYGETYNSQIENGRFDIERDRDLYPLKMKH